MNIGDRIRNRRIELNMTQEELANRVGFKSRSSVNKIEKSVELSLNKIEHIAKALDVTPAYLMGWEETPTESDKYEISFDKIKQNAIEIARAEGNLDRAARIGRMSEYNDKLKLDLFCADADGSTLYIEQYDELDAEYKQQVRDFILKLYKQQLVKNKIIALQEDLKKMEEGN